VYVCVCVIRVQRRVIIVAAVVACKPMNSNSESEMLCSRHACFCPVDLWAHANKLFQLEINRFQFCLFLFLLAFRHRNQLFFSSFFLFSPPLNSLHTQQHTTIHNSRYSHSIQLTIYCKLTNQTYWTKTGSLVYTTHKQHNQSSRGQ
jgi:hypothetical protein